MTNRLNREFATRFYALRQAQRISQQQIADRLFEMGHTWNQSKVSRFERGLASVTLDEAAALARAVNSTLGKIMAPVRRPPEDEVVEDD